MGAGRGSYALINGHGVVWDDPDAPVVEILTPRNTWGFSAKKEFLTEPVQGLRMRFLNETRDFQEDERVVYADGYNETNATNVIEWEHRSRPILMVLRHVSSSLLSAGHSGL